MHDGAQALGIDGTADQSGRAKAGHVRGGKHGVDHCLFDRFRGREINRVGPALSVSDDFAAEKVCQQ